jgi:prepilin-type N-terminal cleavage/methylation domain-containing protein/prepilin-type processing-associated H-X9-DG protein
MTSGDPWLQGETPSDGGRPKWIARQNAPAKPIETSGFSLTELLIVLLILAMLMAMLMPAVSSVKTTAKTMDCQSRMGKMFIAFQRFSEDNRGHYPITVLTGSIAQGPWCWKYWADAIAEMPTPPFAAGQATKGANRFNSFNGPSLSRIFYCSEDRISPTSPLSDFGGDASKIVWDDSVSHGFNGFYLGGGSTWSKKVGVHWSKISSPSETVLITDTMDTGWLTWRSGAKAKGFNPGHGLGSVIDGVRHRNGTVFPLLWADGHASTIRIPTGTAPSSYLNRKEVLGDPNNSSIPNMWDLK